MTIRSTFFLLIFFLMALTADALADDATASNADIDPCLLYTSPSPRD